MTVIAPILTEHEVTQRLCVEVIFTKFHQNWQRNTGRTNRISLRPLVKFVRAVTSLTFLKKIEPPE